MDSRDYFNNKTILITGSNGFLGRNLVEMLKGSSARIIGLGRSRENMNKEIIYYSCDLREYDILKGILEEEKPEFIYNLASLNNTTRDYKLYLDMLDIHLRVLYSFFLNLKDKPFFKLLVNMGSAEEYGSHGGRPFQEDFFEKSISPYAASKTAGTHLAYLIGKSEGFPVITIRPGVIFGPYQAEERFIPYVIKQLAEGKKIYLTPSEQTRDFMPVSKFLQTLQDLIASEGYEPGEIYNIASGVSFRLKEIVLFLKDVIRSSSEICFGALPYRKNEIMNFRVAVNKINKLVDCRLSEDDIKEEMVRMIKPENRERTGKA